MDYLRWQLKYTSGGLRHLGNLVLFVLFLEIPGYPCDLPMDRHPGSKGTEIIHARNFRVQPQAIMGSVVDVGDS